MKTWVVNVTIMITIVIGGFLSLAGFFVAADAADRHQGGALAGAIVALLLPGGLIYGLSRLLRRGAPSVAQGLKFAAILLFILSVPCDGMVIIQALR